jgi:hypothetical protein
MKTLGLLMVAALLLAGIIFEPTRLAKAQNSASHYFPETKHTVRATFWKYWQSNGGLAQQGYPLTEEFTEVSDLDGKPYTVQYFERAVFESHPENKPPFDVLLSQLGTFRYKAKYGDLGSPNQQPNMQNSQLFNETGHRVGGLFLEYWKTHGGLVQQGYPISDEFSEISDLDGNSYSVQYFERAVFELHPEKAPPYNILLSQLGTFQLKNKYPQGAPGGEGQPEPTAPAQPTVGGPIPGSTRTPTGTNCQPVADSRKSSISSTGPVEIENVAYSGQEKVVLRNKTQASVDVSRWVLRDKNETQQRFVFPAGSSIPAGASVEVYTEPGHPYSFNSKSSIWNNCGDSLELLDASGAVVATYAYGTHLLP